jgi:RNA polymerase sigma factor (sigma-70 family)
MNAPLRIIKRNGWTSRKVAVPANLPCHRAAWAIHKNKVVAVMRGRILLAMHEDDHTTIAVQRYLDELAGVTGDASAEPIVGALLGRAVNRLHILCAALLLRSYPRLTKAPLNLETEEMLSSVVERLLKAMRSVRPTNVRQFFALANQHMRWELNDLARRLDKQEPVAELHESAISAPPPTSGSQITPDTRRMLEAIEALPEDEREVFDLVRIQGMAQTEVADLIGVAVKTVQRRLNRCLVRLAAELGDLQRRGEPRKKA